MPGRGIGSSVWVDAASVGSVAGVVVALVERDVSELLGVETGSPEVGEHALKLAAATMAHRKKMYRLFLKISGTSAIPPKARH